MAVPGTGAQVELGGQIRTLRLTLNALVRLEQETGKNALGQDVWQSLNALTLRGLLAACLSHETPPPTAEQVGDWLTLDNLPLVAQALGLAAQRGMPNQIAAALTGSGSGPTDGTTSA